MTNIQLHMNTIQDTAHKTYHNVMFDTYCTMVEIHVIEQTISIWVSWQLFVATRSS